MSPKDVKNYRFLERAIRIAERKLDEARERSVLRDKVTGSNPEYPYEERSFNIGGDGYHSSEVASAEREVERLHQLKSLIEYASAVITDPVDKIIFDRTMQGQSQTQIGNYLHMNHSAVSKRLSKLCEYF